MRESESSENTCQTILGLIIKERSIQCLRLPHSMSKFSPGIGSAVVGILTGDWFCGQCRNFHRGLVPGPMSEFSPGIGSAVMLEFSPVIGSVVNVEILTGDWFRGQNLVHRSDSMFAYHVVRRLLQKHNAPQYALHNPHHNQCTYFLMSSMKLTRIPLLFCAYFVCARVCVRKCSNGLK